MSDNQHLSYELRTSTVMATLQQVRLEELMFKLMLEELTMKRDVVRFYVIRVLMKISYDFFEENDDEVRVLIGK